MTKKKIQLSILAYILIVFSLISISKVQCVQMDTISVQAQKYYPLKITMTAYSGIELTAQAEAGEDIWAFLLDEENFNKLAEDLADGTLDREDIFALDKTDTAVSSLTLEWETNNDVVIYLVFFNDNLLKSVSVSYSYEFYNTTNPLDYFMGFAIFIIVIVICIVVIKKSRKKNMAVNSIYNSNLQQAPTNQTPPAYHQTTYQQQPINQNVFCSKCGANAKGTNFCPNCGEKVN